MTGETVQATNRLRWVRRKTAAGDNEVRLHEHHGIGRWVLQQAWQSMETGKIRWQDVPVESEASE